MHSLIVIFGISGDLASRKLLPALARIASADQLKDVSILGVSRRSISLPKIFDGLTGGEKIKKGKQKLVLATDMLQMDISEHSHYDKLHKYIARKQREIGTDTELQVLYYLSVPPSAVLPIVKLLGKNKLNGKGTKLLLEKPFGFDLDSAKNIITKTAEYFSEEQVYRIDHYLAKEMAQNIIVFRATNAIFSNLWDKNCIEAIEIIASEKIGIENRAQFYEQTGALRDIVQSHLMQLLALTIMEVPNTLDWQVLPQLRTMALNQIEPINADITGQTVTRGQYQGYTKEVDNPASKTETFVGLTVFSGDPNWQGVPIRLTTGKALAEKTTEIRVHFKKKQAFASNMLTLHIQPSESVQIDLWAKRPGYDRNFEKMNLSFSYGDQVKDLPEAYEQVIIDAIRSDKSLFASSEEVLRAWEILEPVQKSWSMRDDDLKRYEAGATASSIVAK